MVSGMHDSIKTLNTVEYINLGYNTRHICCFKLQTNKNAMISGDMLSYQWALLL